MKTTLKILGVLVVIVALLLGGLATLASTKPMTASKLLWPLVESYMIREDFVGITTNGSPQPGLYKIKPTGVSTQPIFDAANQFLDSLSEDQREAASFAVDDSEWRRWANIHLSHRQGVGFLDMNESQSDAAYNLIGTGLSDRGFKTAQDIMKLEGHLADLKNNYVEYGEKRYWLTVMGEPSMTNPWGWQLDGHHLIVNYFVLGDQVVATPMFLGSEPVTADESRFGPLSVFDEETAVGLTFMQALNEDEQAIATISKTKPGNNNLGELFQDNAIVPIEGIQLSTLDASKQELARSAIRLHVDNIRGGHANIKMAEIEAHWDQTYFAWVGGVEDDSVFYYRIQSPVVMIEFDHQPPVALDGPREPSREHVHVVIRTPNGNDYGKDLLRQHLEQHPH